MRVYHWKFGRNMETKMTNPRRCMCFASDPFAFLPISLSPLQAIRASYIPFVAMPPPTHPPPLFQSPPLSSPERTTNGVVETTFLVSLAALLSLSLSPSSLSPFPFRMRRRLRASSSSNPRTDVLTNERRRNSVCVDTIVLCLGGGGGGGGKREGRRGREGGKPGWVRRLLDI